ncbi:MAG: hypothetical protein J7545_01520 [Roseofilum sp. SBFL]|uniref:hypothetical protein n=1 Tax=unclassified Roseofilum TaxID=2620099 RepID=UPI001B2DDD0B|nr:MULTISPECIES: hypothetical protein [unclassified Roseofilum]MBP0012447.1 hypothetical protein [Roseofilum sp. SID3]MBP0025278.1 hypothetical protein [Roseofilum sp. SID2]MBP0036541.1 hypothetical protein [Roseofilum sp. SID1]MBP0040645.1 hypothetical protein [Roseofilum sp. SBFL]
MYSPFQSQAIAWRMAAGWISAGSVWLLGLSPVQAQFANPNRPTFFQEGYQQLQEEVQRLQASPDDRPLLTVDTGKLQWQHFISRAGEFQVWMPTGLSTHEQQSMPTLVGNLAFDVLTTNQEKSRFIVAFSDRQTEIAHQGEAILAQVLDTIVQDTGFSVQETMGTDNQQDIVLNDGQENIQLRMMVMGDRIYILGVGYQNTQIKALDIEAFFNSFQPLF